MKVFQSLIFLFIGFSCFQGEAYILKPEMILNRLDKNQGSKVYKISQNILFLDRSRLDDTFQLKEIWWKYANRSYLQVSSVNHPQLKLNLYIKNLIKHGFQAK